MKQPSPQYVAALTRSHPVFIKAQLLLDGVVEVDDLALLPEGQVTVDYASETRRSLTATLLDPDGSLTPISAYDALTPYGAEVRLFYGVGAFPRTLVAGTIATYETATEQEWLSIATCRLSVVEVADDGSQTIRIEGFDRSRAVARNLFTVPYIIAAGTNYVTAISAMVQDRLPGVEMDLVDGIDETTPLVVLDPETDPWAEITKMATTIGCDAYFNSDGVFVLRPVVDPTDEATEVDWTYSEGVDSIMLSVNRRFDDDPGYNGVVLAAESTTISTPLRSEIWDLNPNSPTYAEGRYGRVPKFVTSPYPTTQSQCDAFARAELQRSIGGTEQITLAAVPHPLHEPGDVVRVIRRAAGIEQIGVVDSFTIPIGVTESMPVTLRRRRALT